MSVKPSKKKVTRTRDWSSFLSFSKKLNRKKSRIYLPIVNVKISASKHVISAGEHEGVMILD